MEKAKVTDRHALEINRLAEEYYRLTHEDENVKNKNEIIRCKNELIACLYDKFCGNYDAFNAEKKHDTVTGLIFDEMLIEKWTPGEAGGAGAKFYPYFASIFKLRMIPARNEKHAPILFSAFITEDNDYSIDDIINRIQQESIPDENTREFQSEECKVLFAAMIEIAEAINRKYESRKTFNYHCLFFTGNGIYFIKLYVALLKLEVLMSLESKFIGTENIDFSDYITDEKCRSFDEYSKTGLRYELPIRHQVYADYVTEIKGKSVTVQAISEQMKKYRNAMKQFFAEKELIN